jgi:uncharacterized protein YoaH (UPF0181 family)
MASNITHRNILNDAMANFDQTSGASDDYCKGVAVGAVAALMATGMSWNEAFRHVGISLKTHSSFDMTRTLTTDNMPESWLKEYVSMDKRNEFYE